MQFPHRMMTNKRKVKLDFVNCMLNRNNVIFALITELDCKLLFLGKGIIAEKSRFASLGRRKTVSIGSDDDSSALQEPRQETEDDSDVLSEQHPVPTLSDDSDAVSERELDKPKESDDSENDDTNTLSPSEADEIEEKQELKDIALSESDSNKQSDEERKVIFSFLWSSLIKNQAD